MTEPALTFLMADDDPDDQLLMELAFKQVSPEATVRTVGDGVELLDYLRGDGRYAGLNRPPLPEVIFLDLNMPRLDGLQTLAQIKADPSLRRVPVVVLTTSYAEADIERSYALGASAFMTKPMSFDRLTESFRCLTDFYLHVAALPSHMPSA